MEKLIFCYVSDGTDPKDLLLAASIRKYGGALAQSPIWVLVPQPLKNISNELEEIYASLKIQIIHFKTDVDTKFPFINFVSGAANAESRAIYKSENLAWIGSNTIIFNEPKHFLLGNGKNVGYRPVHHTNIGSFYNDPIDKFWDLVYQKCNVSEDKIFPMKTHVDNNHVRPYINAGCLIVKPERGILQSWWDYYKQLYQLPELKVYYKENYLYAIFIHQAILSGVILSELEKDELHELPFNYNYPLNLYYTCPLVYRVKSINDLITVRYEDPHNLKKIPIQEPLRSWIIDKMDMYHQKKLASGKKIKYGKVPLIYPIPIIIAGALVNNKANFETLGDVGIMGINPPIVYISSSVNHHTNQGILEHETFSINFPTTQLLTKTDYCGIKSGKDVDKSKLFNIFFGELKTAPMIRECPVNLECKVIKEFSIQHRQVFVGDVVQSYINEDYMIENGDSQKFADMTKLDPIIYALDNRYYKIGEIIGVGYQEGKNLKQK